jgi:heat shock protein HtpX
MGMQATFRDLIATNKRNSFLLVLVFVLFATAVLMILGLGILALIDTGLVMHLHWGQALVMGGLALAVSLLLSILAYFNGDDLVLALSGAHEIRHQDDPQLFNVVEEMAIAAGIPMPRVYLINDPAPNAFATGRDPRHAVVAITTGLRHKLNREELQGVIGHEVSHIRNFDIRLMLLMAVLVGSIVMMADLFWQMLAWGPRGSSRSSSSSSSNNDSGGGWLVALILLVLAIVLSLLAPILAQIIQFAVSRQREYLADASAVELTRNPLGLASALRKIDHDPAVLELANRGTAHLFLANPLKKFEDRSASIFASHPPIGERIRRLEKLAHQPQLPA